MKSDALAGVSYAVFKPPEFFADGTPMPKPLTLYNTLTRAKETFTPLDASRVRLYVCGPTVYDFAHIGNARPIIVFDVLYRLLRRVYGAWSVVYARNITDVDDKINARACRDFPGLPLNEAIGRVTGATERQFHSDVERLGCLPPDHEPRATHHIAAMVGIIERLVARGVAYVAEDHVLFSPRAMDALPGAPRYGALARRSLDEMLAGARVDVAPYKTDPMDFVLWKPSGAQDPGWPSPCGIAPLGRPGWHIECSALSMATLLAPFGGGLCCDDADLNIFDIHGGGVDLVFPHHENEIAQSCCAFGTQRMAQIWMHNGFLQVDGEKMSKSQGNFVTIDELLSTSSFGGRRWSGEAVRLAMLRTHYRQPIDWTARALEEAERALDKWTDALGDAPADAEPDDRVFAALLDDLNTPAAVAELHRLANDPSESARGVLKASANLLGLLNEDRADRAANGGATLAVAQQTVEEIIARRAEARARKDWRESDRIRDELASLGVTIRDNKDGTTDWEATR